MFYAVLFEVKIAIYPNEAVLIVYSKEADCRSCKSMYSLPEMQYFEVNVFLFCFYLQFLGLIQVFVNIKLLQTSTSNLFTRRSFK